MYTTQLSEQKIGSEFFSTETHSLFSLHSHSNANLISRRMTQEMQVLSKTLVPCEESSILVRTGEQPIHLMQALVSGPSESPYAYGLYLFDISIPEGYPSVPPVFSLKTTGNGQVRFNPNLYANGFVCLSILNTWDGPPEEKWNPSHSNILQILMSLQTLVMDNEVVQKEPTYRNYSPGSPENRHYSFVVRYNNIKHAMIEQIRNPPPFFRMAVLQHFYLLRDKILQLVSVWLEDARVNSTFRHVDVLVREHNPTTCSLFYARGLYEVFHEAVEELKECLYNIKID